MITKVLVIACPRADDRALQGTSFPVAPFASRRAIDSFIILTDPVSTRPDRALAGLLTVRAIPSANIY